MALRRVGVESLVVERADSIREIGAGLSLWPNATNALRELRVESRVRDSASVIERNSVRAPAGRLLAVNELGDISRNAGAPCLCVPRAVLQRILLEELPPAWVRTGAHCVGFNDSTAILEDGQRIEADVLVGAEGISSVIRAGLHGTEPPRYAGYTCWRAILRNEGALPDCAALLAVGAGSQFGLWPCMALEDAVMLAYCLSTVRQAESALREYERLRIPLTSAIVRVSRRAGRILQLDQPALVSARDWFMGSSLGRHLGMRMFRKLLTYKVPKLNPRA